MKKTGFLFVLAVLGFFVVIPGSEAYAVQLFPKRIVIKPGERTVTVRVKNEATTPRQYSFSWRRISMTKDGRGLNTEKRGAPPEYRPADDYIRYSPRRMIVQPGEIQTFRMLVRRPGDMEDGEYRSHLVVEEAPYKDSDVPTQRVVGAGVQLIPGRAFPVHLLHGDAYADIEILEARKTDNQITVKVAHTGNRSFFALMELHCNFPNNERSHLQQKRMPIYQEAETKEVTFRIRKSTDPCQSITMIVKADSTDLRFGETIETIEFPVR